MAVGMSSAFLAEICMGLGPSVSWLTARPSLGVAERSASRFGFCFRGASERRTCASPARPMAAGHLHNLKSRDRDQAPSGPSAFLSQMGKTSRQVARHGPASVRHLLALQTPNVAPRVRPPLGRPPRPVRRTPMLPFEKGLRQGKPQASLPTPSPKKQEVPTSPKRKSPARPPTADAPHCP